MKEETKRKKEKWKWSNLLAGFAIFVSLGLMAYPFVSNYIFENRKDSVVKTYQKNCENMTDQVKEKELAKAQHYNKVICSEHIQLQDPFKSKSHTTSQESYLSILNLQKDEIMGAVCIPKIDVNLPIYHGTSASVLEEGSGHLEGTSLPIGGENCHTVLTGHTGLSNAKLFTDLTELSVGDEFFLYVLDLKMAYKVDQIQVVEPEDTSALAIEEGEDLCTLVTCTPYGINSHRLFVRGHRVPYVEKKAKSTPGKRIHSQWMRQYCKSLLIAILVILFLFGGSLVCDRVKEKRKQNRE